VPLHWSLNMSMRPVGCQWTLRRTRSIAARTITIVVLFAIYEQTAAPLDEEAVHTTGKHAEVLKIVRACSIIVFSVEAIMLSWSMNCFATETIILTYSALRQNQWRVGRETVVLAHRVS
jgi:hypothetical protein